MGKTTFEPLPWPAKKLKAFGSLNSNLDEIREEYNKVLLRKLMEMKGEKGRLSQSITDREWGAALVTALIDKASFRIGSDESSKREDPSFGITTIKHKHLKFKDDTVQFSYKGKSKPGHPIIQNKIITDKLIIDSLKIMRDHSKKYPCGKKAFFCIEQPSRTLTRSMVNDWIKKYAKDATPHTFRSVNGTNLLINLIENENMSYRQSIEIVANELGHQRAGKIDVGQTAEKSYLLPDVIRKYGDGKYAHQKGLYNIPNRRKFIKYLRSNPKANHRKRF